MRNCNHQTGFTLLVVLFLIAGFGVAMAALGTLWHSHVQREKEAELLFIGDQYRQALESYRASRKVGEATAPKTLAALLEDYRDLRLTRHLRKLYRDPITVSDNWGLVRDAQGGITGIYSQSERKPFKTANFPARYETFKGAESYRAWIFQLAPDQSEVKQAQTAMKPPENQPPLLRPR
jgi:type II secretory pathway pseudopilin PulG